MVAQSCECAYPWEMTEIEASFVELHVSPLIATPNPAEAASDGAAC